MYKNVLTCQNKAGLMPLWGIKLAITCGNKNMCDLSFVDYKKNSQIYILSCSSLAHCKHNVSTFWNWELTNGADIGRKPENKMKKISSEKEHSWSNILSA